MILKRSSDFSELVLFVGGSASLIEFDCPNCRLPFTLIARVKGKVVEKLCLSNDGSDINLYYCWRCNLKLNLFVYSYKNSQYEIVSFQSGTDDGCVYEPYPNSFPEKEIFLVEMDSREADSNRELAAIRKGDSTEYFSRVHGMNLECEISLTIDEEFTLPFHIVFPQCPNCLEKNQLSVAIPGVIEEINFAGNRYVNMQFIVCKSCETVSCAHFVD